MKLRYFVLFFVVFETMQILDLVLTQHALLNSSYSELNPLYKYDWFIVSKLFMPVFITTCFYIYEHNKKGMYIIPTMKVMLTIYLFILLNNSFAVLL
jgi:hypothetical protein